MAGILLHETAKYFNKMKIIRLISPDGSVIAWSPYFDDASKRTIEMQFRKYVASLQYIENGWQLEYAEREVIA